LFGSIGVEAADESTINIDAKQVKEQENNCETGATCGNVLFSSITAGTFDAPIAGHTEINADVEQESKSSNDCDTGATCESTMFQNVDLTGGDAMVDQFSDVSYGTRV
jgi:hypothetical protein